MARLRGHRPLDLEQPLYVRRAVFTIAGRTFTMGDALPWRELGIAPRKLHQLWYARRIGHELAGERGGAESPVALVTLPTSLPSTPSDAGPAATTSPEQAARPAASTVVSRPPHNHKRR